MTSLAVTDDARYLVSAGDKVVKVWDYSMRLDINFQVGRCRLQQNSDAHIAAICVECRPEDECEKDIMNSFFYIFTCSRQLDPRSSESFPRIGLYELYRSLVNFLYLQNRMPIRSFTLLFVDFIAAIPFRL